MEIQDDKQRCAFCGGRVDASGKPLPEDGLSPGASELCFTCGRLQKARPPREEGVCG
ncbi:hypothetical protein [Parapedobacter pyrenivorans]|uniref:hypothetical protein n=1 Tax=Parapedobacter pyrenivorans TaxID=1305674 RepID=UPI0033421595